MVKGMLCAVALLALAAVCAAEGELIYPWDNPPPAPAADCLDVPCVPCVFFLPGLTTARPAAAPCPVPEDAKGADDGEAAVALATSAAAE